MNDQELWRVNLTAGYHVLLQGREEAPASRFDIEAFPPGATDAQVLGIAKIAGAQDGNLHEGLSFAVAKTGTWLIVVGSYCDGGSPGPYQLTVTGGSAPPRSSVRIVSHAVKGQMTTVVVHPSGTGTVTVSDAVLPETVRPDEISGAVSTVVPPPGPAVNTGGVTVAVN